MASVVQNYGIDMPFYSSHDFAFLIFSLKSNFLALINGFKFTWMITHFQDVFFDLVSLNSGTNHEWISSLAVLSQKKRWRNLPSFLICSNHKNLRDFSISPAFEMLWFLFPCTIMWLWSLKNLKRVAVFPHSLCPYACLKLSFTKIRFMTCFAQHTP